MVSMYDGTSLLTHMDIHSVGLRLCLSPELDCMTPFDVTANLNSYRM